MREHNNWLPLVKLILARCESEANGYPLMKLAPEIARLLVEQVDRKCNGCGHPHHAPGMCAETVRGYEYVDVCACREPICENHNIPLVCYCPACRGEIKSPARAKASAENGKRGGRPKKPK